MEVNKLICGDCLEVMKDFPDNHIDLTVTSPPYDNLRTYKGYSFNFGGIANELYRITKQGGVVVWVVGDATIKGSETGTSFKQVLYFKEIGFNLHDTMIWNKGSFTAVGSLKTRYAPVFEYMFIFSKCKISTFNPIIDRENKYQSGTFSKNKRLTDGTIGDKANTGRRRKVGQRYNIWKISPDNKNKHPAPFPEQLANDHIISWSNKGDIVLDPMCGSGTTCKMAKVNGREYMGIDVSGEYIEIARNRIKAIPETLFRRR
ncbi:MAG: site-specific DNA-methyltransferase [Parcubacteria group bacterium]|nr:site-specific DNA-methyltransferase [Parcubacteria group bacterium]